MKKNLPIYFLLSLLFIWNGCKKERFDFCRLDKLQASGEWGIPLLNTAYTIEDILTQLEDNDYISQNADGQLFLNYSFDQRRVVTDSILLSFPETFAKYQWRETFYSPAGYINSKDTTFLFKIPDDNIIIRRGVIMHGYFDLAISGNIGNIVISCKALKDASGRTFIRNVTGNYHQRIDLSGYSLSFSYEDTNRIAMDVHFSFQGTGESKEYFMNIDASCQKLRLQEVTGKMNPFRGNFSDVLDIGKFLNKNRYGGSLTLFNPKITIHLKNGFNRIRGVTLIDELHFTGQGSSSDILTTYPSTIQILEGMDAAQDIEGLSSVFFSSNFDKLNFKGYAIVNPLGFEAGELSVRENSTLDIKANIGIPFELKSNEFYFYDTINFNITDSVNMYDFIQGLVFRYVIGNSLPFNVNSQVYFYNSTQQTLVDSLFYPYLQLNGAFQEKMVETAAILEIKQNRINQVLNADKIIFRFKVNTDGRKVFVNAKHGLKAILGVKIKYEFDPS